MCLTPNSISDDQAAEKLLDQIHQPIDSLVADGAYDTRRVYQRLKQHSPNIEVLIPPRLHARIWQHGNRQQTPLPRDLNLRAIRQHGRQSWKQQSGYHIRSLAETMMFRLKTIFSPRLSARLLETQASQSYARYLALNRMTQLGMPLSLNVG